MEIKVQAKKLASQLKMAAKVINSKNSLPILGDFFIDVKNDVMIITASDSEEWLSLKCPIESCDQDIRFCVSAQDFLRAIDNLNDVTITLSVDKQTHTLTCDYGNGRFSIPYENANEFPQASMNTENATEFIADSKKILKAIELTGFATANDELRPVMNGIHFDFFTDGMVCATTDGHKLARYKDSTLVNTNNDGNVPNFTLPKKPANVLMTILSAFDGDVKLCFNDKALSINNKDFKLSARLLDFKYPNYDSVIPNNNNIIVTVDKNAILQALKRVMTMANNSSYLVELDFAQGQVTISAKDIDFSKSASETVTCDCNTDIKIGFKCPALIEIINNIDDENIIIELSEPSRAGVFYSAVELTRDEYLSLCMPMLIQ